MRVVKSYVRENYEKEKFARAAEDVRTDFTRAEKLLALFAFVFSLWRKSKRTEADIDALKRALEDRELSLIHI